MAFKSIGRPGEDVATTLNEPWVVVDGGYLHGALAPGHRSIFEAPRVAHHLLLAHGAGVQAYRAQGRGQIGIVLNIEPKHPASQDPKDLEAVRRADAYMNRQYLEPVLGRPYPAELAGIYGPGWDDRVQRDIPKIAQPIDFLGVNPTREALRATIRLRVRSGPRRRGCRARPTRRPDGKCSSPAGLTETLL